MGEALYAFLGALGYGHPLHPVVVHLIIGPVIAALLFSLTARLLRKPGFHRTARQLTVFSLIAWFPAVTVGVLDWLHFYGGTSAMVEFPAKIIGAGALLLILTGNIALFRRLAPGSPVHLALYLAAAITVGAIGLMGGNIVYGTPKPAPSSGQGTPVTTDTSGFKQVETAGYRFWWKVEGTQVRMKVSYATTGWVGVGFSKDPLMHGAHIIIGYTEGGQAVVEDHFGYSGHSHAPEEKVGGKNSLTQTSGSEKNGVTTLEWTMPLNTGNPGDLVLVPGETVTVLLAHGEPEDKDLTSYHGQDGRTTVTIQF